MYEFVKGELVEVTSAYAVIEANGVGYRLLVPASYVGTLGQLGERVLLYTSFVVRELSQTLFGFRSKEERELFEMVTAVSGIGPKTALSLLGHFSREAFLQAVQNNDIVQISKVPGIGKRTAERLLIELKGKLKELLAFLPKESLGGGFMQDALTALLNLGYSEARAEKALQKAQASLSEEAELSEIIAEALKLSN